MRPTREAFALGWTAVALVVAVLGFFIGGTLRPDDKPLYLFDTDAPAYGTPTNIAATSPGGFTGVGETDGGPSRVVVSGRIVELTEDAMVLEGAQGQRTLVSFSDAPTLYRLEAADLSALRQGVNVSLRLNQATDTAEAVLVLSEP